MLKTLDSGVRRNDVKSEISTFYASSYLTGISFRRQYPVPVNYKGILIDCGYRVDLLVENELILELKTVEQINEIHKAQLISYLRLSNISTGLLINFNVKVLKDGIKRFVL